MTKKFLSKIVEVFCVVIVCVISATSASANCESVEWRGYIYPDNKDYIKVELNALKLKNRQYLQSISFHFTFYNAQNVKIGDQPIRFAEEPRQGLDPARYEIYLKHSYNSASSIGGGKMDYICGIRGTMLNAPKLSTPMKVTQWDEYSAANDIAVIGDPHAESAKDLDGMWKGYDANDKEISSSASINQSGSLLTFDNGLGSKSKGRFEGRGVVLAEDWNVRGKISSSRNRINWSNNTYWIKSTVEVTSAPTSGVCTISGQILNNKTEYATKIGLYHVGDPSRQLFSLAVDSNGQYRSTNVPKGTYLVIPKGRYPRIEEEGIAEYAWGVFPVPRSQKVTCPPNGVVRIPDFRITGEG